MISPFAEIHQAFTLKDTVGLVSLTQFSPSHCSKEQLLLPQENFIMMPFRFISVVVDLRIVIIEESQHGFFNSAE